jgi:hypothetical protein
MHRLLDRDEIAVAMSNVATVSITPAPMIGLPSASLSTGPFRILNFTTSPAVCSKNVTVPSPLSTPAPMSRLAFEYSSDFPVDDAVKTSLKLSVARKAPLASCLNVNVPVSTSDPSTPQKLDGKGPSTTDS